MEPAAHRAEARGSPADHPAGWRRASYLKADLFSRVERGVYASDGEPVAAVRRDTRYGRWWARPIALHLHRREIRALRAAAGLEGCTDLLYADRFVIVRRWIEGRPMQDAAPRDPAYYRRALRLLMRLHRRGIAHNDLAKQPNWLVTPEGAPAVTDFQLATVHRRRTRWFRTLAREDLRHMLKHKRRYCRERVTARQWAILRTPTLASRIWMRTWKPVYRFVTRRVFRWQDREGAGDRHW